MAEDKKSEDAEAKPAGGKKRLIIILLAVVLLAGGGGAGWFFFMKPKPDAEEEAPAAAPDKGKPKTFGTLDPFTVNLADEGGDRLVQVGVVLELADAKVAGELSNQMPAVRNAILLLLSSKYAKELLTRAGKEKLAEEIAVAAGSQLGWEPPDDEEDAPAPKARKGAAKQEEAADASAEPAKKPRKKKRRPPPNPVEAVHFSQFLVQ